jgi:hypothetical protein
VRRGKTPIQLGLLERANSTQLTLSSEVFNSLVNGAEKFPFHVGRRAACHLLHAGFFLGLYFDPEAGGNM